MVADFETKANILVLPDVFHPFSNYNSLKTLIALYQKKSFREC